MAATSVISAWWTCRLLCAYLLLPLTLGQGNPPKLLLISMDSLMYKFIENLPANSIPHFDYFRQNGVLLKQMMNVFPSVTYANHYTLITGLYPETHGIVHNHFYDPVLKEHFDFGRSKDNLDSKWYDVGAEPIYVTNTKAGGNRKSGVVLFPTANARVKDVAPDRMVDDDGTYPPMYPPYGFPFVNMAYRARVDKIISWFTAERDPINLGLLYFPEPDELSHEFGPDSQEVRNEIVGPLNDALGYLRDKLRDHKLLESINVILTADHGQTTATRVVILDDYLDPSAYTLGGLYKNGLVLEMYPGEGKEDQIIQNLTRSSDLEVYQKDSPEMRTLHHSRSPRIAPIVVTATEGTVLLKDKKTFDSLNTNTTRGVHGYDPHKVPAVRPLFMAVGPSFKRGLVSAQFNSVDVYPIMCHLLGLTPAPNNGSLDNVRHLLVETNGAERRAFPATSVVGGHIATSNIFMVEEDLSAYMNSYSACRH